MPSTKDFKTIEEQINILDSRGLKFKIEKKQLSYLAGITILTLLTVLNLCF